MNFMPGIHYYLPATNRVSRVYIVTAVLYLPLVRHVMFISPVKYVLYCYISTVGSLCPVPNMTVFCKLKTKLRGLNPHANYTDRAGAAGRRS